MNQDIDQQIREALRAEDEDLAAFLDEKPTLFDQVFETFRSSSRFLVILSVTFTLVFLVGSIVCVVQFFQAESTKVQLAWVIGFMWSSLAVAMLKLWYWMEMQRHQITREIKRVELEIASIARRLNSKR